MPAINNFYTLEPAQWLFPTHGDVIEGKRRAEEYFATHGTYEGAEF